MALWTFGRQSKEFFLLWLHAYFEFVALFAYCIHTMPEWRFSIQFGTVFVGGNGLKWIKNNYFAFMWCGSHKIIITSYTSLNVNAILDLGFITQWKHHLKKICTVTTQTPAFRDLILKVTFDCANIFCFYSFGNMSITIGCAGWMRPVNLWNNKWMSLIKTDIRRNVNGRLNLYNQTGCLRLYLELNHF